MHDRKTIRRRRAVLALFVAGSLALLTLSFGDGLRSVERGAFEVFGPIQEGASKALKPARDAFGWVGDTLDAKGEVEDLRRQRDELRVALTEARGAERENVDLRQRLGMRRRLGIEDQGPLVASVVTEPTNVWSSTLTVDKGSNDGVAEGQPVIAGGGLVGRVDAVTGRQAVIQLITDDGSSIGARVNEVRGTSGLLQPEVGDPDDLRLDLVARVDNVDEDQTIVTAGSSSDRFPSSLPAGLPIGRVTEIDDNDRVHVRPFANVRRLEYVDILTRPAR